VSELDLGKQVSNIRAVLQTVEAQVARGRVPQEGLADFKSAVDEVRLRLWGIMSAASSGEYDSFVERFRLRRATEILRELAQDVQEGKVPKGHPEMEWLIEAARNLIAAAR
jgi:phosphoglycolate phosphatase-like HAD superfamily hydrolase